jgi:hypothetical protein
LTSKIHALAKNQKRPQCRNSGATQISDEANANKLFVKPSDMSGPSPSSRTCLMRTLCFMDLENVGKAFRNCCLRASSGQTRIGLWIFICHWLPPETDTTALELKCKPLSTSPDYTRIGHPPLLPQSNRWSVKTNLRTKQSRGIEKPRPDTSRVGFDFDLDFEISSIPDEITLFSFGEPKQKSDRKRCRSRERSIAISRAGSDRLMQERKSETRDQRLQALSSRTRSFK